MVQQDRGGRPSHVLAAVNLKVLGSQLDRQSWTAPDDRVLHRGLQVHIEGVTKLVDLCLAQTVAVGASNIHSVIAQPVLLQVGENFLKGLLADTADAASR